MAKIEKIKNQADESIFPVTVADAVLMGDGKTLKGELSELGSKVGFNVAIKAEDSSAHFPFYGKSGEKFNITNEMSTSRTLYLRKEEGVMEGQISYLIEGGETKVVELEDDFKYLHIYQSPSTPKDFSFNIERADSVLSKKFSSLEKKNEEVKDSTRLTNEKAILQYCINNTSNLIKDDKFLSIGNEEGTWEVGLLNIDGTVDASQTKYITSKFIEYNAEYSQPYSMLYVEFDHNGVTDTKYKDVAYFTKDDKKLVAAFAVSGGCRMLLIPRGYCVKVSTRAAYSSTIFYYSGESASRQISKIVESTEKRIENVEKEISKIEDDTRLLTKNVDNVYVSSEVVLSEENATFYNDYIWNSSGEKVDGGNFGTIRTEIPSAAIIVNTNNYGNVGVFGGAFIDDSGSWISSFSTLETTEIQIPTNAKYVDITISVSKGIYKEVTFVFEKSILNGLLVKYNQFDVRFNQFYGKKVCIIGTSVAFGQYSTKAYAKIASERLGFEVIPSCLPGLAIHANEENGTLVPLPYGSLSLTISEYSSNGTNIANTPIPLSGDEWQPGGIYNNYYKSWEHVFDKSDVDLWVFATGPNNTNFGMDDWDAFDKNNWKYKDDSPFSSHRTTFLGAMLYLMDKMYSLGSEQRMVLLIDSAYNYEKTKEAFSILNQQWNIPVIDLWGKINTTPKSLLAIRSENGTNNHPSTFAHEKLGEMFVGELLRIS